MAATKRMTRRTAMHRAPAAGPRREAIDIKSARTGECWSRDSLKPDFYGEFERSLDAPNWVASGSHRVSESFGTPIVYGEISRERLS